MPGTRAKAVDYANYFTTQQFVGLNESGADLINFPHTVGNNTKNRKYIAFFDLFSMEECANIYFGKDAAETGLITDENDCEVERENNRKAHEFTPQRANVVSKKGQGERSDVEIGTRCLWRSIQHA